MLEKICGAGTSELSSASFARSHERMTQKESESLATKLKKLREARALSQQDLAVKAGLSISVVSQIEQGKKLNPRADTIFALADALGVSADMFRPAIRRPQPPKKNRKK